MRKFPAITACAIGILLAGAASACCVADLRLPEDEVRTLTSQANSGDRAAMWRLFQHYQLTTDAWNHAYWGERLAHLDDNRVLLSLADFYDSLGTPFLCKRAVELAEKRAMLSLNKAERDAALKVSRHYAGKDSPLRKCGR